MLGVSWVGEQPRPGAPNSARATTPLMDIFVVLESEIDIVRSPQSFSALMSLPLHSLLLKFCVLVDCHNFKFPATGL